MTDHDFLAKAIDVGNQVARPYNFGAVVVKDGELLAADHTRVYETHDPSMHAEICAIRIACQKLGSDTIDGAVLYASHEPCTMCFACAAWAHIDRIVYATPGREQEASMYEFSHPDIQALAQQLARPMIVERIPHSI